MSFNSAYAQRCLRDLGWPVITEALAALCRSEPGRHSAARVMPTSDRAELESVLQLVSEFVALQATGSTLPLQGIEEIVALVDRCKRGGVLAPEPMCRVAAAATSLADVRRLLDHHAELLPGLTVLASDLVCLRSLAGELNNTFDEAGEIRDNASPTLAAARKRCASLHQGLKSQLEAYIHRQDIEDLLQDDYYTVRDGRYVLPVVSSFQGELNGILHGSSQTGQTVFLEPEAFITRNNELTLAEAQVVVEERRVLEERSRWIADDGDALVAGVARGICLDLLQARAMLGGQLGGVVCHIADDGKMSLLGALNPLLALRKVPVVPNDITLDSGHAFLVVTGPNTGGKTVTLNTVGLLSLMFQAGIPIPVHEESRALLFRGVHAVLGDPQDIQKDLSTFSGHLAVLQEVLDEAVEDHLVLLDEIIVGTDPGQGAALAIAVLEALADRGARGLATTHYPRVKALALEDARFANASVGVDVETQAPSYRLNLGTPGDSSPLRVAEQLGFDATIVKRAHALASGGEDLSKAIRNLEEARDALQAQQRSLEAAREETRRERDQLASMRTELAARADEEVAALHKSVRDEAEAALKVIREQVRAAQRANEPTILKAARRKVVATKETAEASLVQDEGGSSHPPLPAPPEVGDSVWVHTLSAVGEVIDVRSGDRFLVAAGGLKLTVRLAQLGLAPACVAKAKPKPSVQPRAAATTSAEDDLVGPPQTSAITLDLRGFRRDEVEDALVPFLDRLYGQNEAAAWIIHGHGTGAIRDEVRSLLRSSPYIRDSRPGRRGEGGDGITLVWLDTD